MFLESEGSRGQYGSSAHAMVHKPQDERPSITKLADFGSSSLYYIIRSTKPDRNRVVPKPTDTCRKDASSQHLLAKCSLKATSW